MKNIIMSIILLAGLIISAPTISDTSVSDLGSCLTDALNGKERKRLAKWIFFAIAAHPEIKSYSNITAKNINDSDEYVGKLITRLLTGDCPDKLNAAYKSDPLAIEKSFELVGQVAMQELLANQNVTKAITNYGQYADQEKIGSILLKK